MHPRLRAAEKSCMFDTWLQDYGIWVWSSWGARSQGCLSRTRRLAAMLDRDAAAVRIGSDMHRLSFPER